VIEALVRERERVRVAQSIHDGLGHYLSAAALQLEAARLQPDAAPGFTSRARELVHAGMRELRRAIAAVRDTLAPSCFDTAIAELVTTSSEAGIATTLAIEGEPRPLAPPVELAVYRAIQEALTNVRKHAQARRADVVVRYGAARVDLIVRDDGRGCPGLVEGVGLRGLRARAHELGGELAVASTEAGGTSVALTVTA
jgi:signal transduction histidine kinase